MVRFRPAEGSPFSSYSGESGVSNAAELFRAVVSEGYVDYTTNVRLGNLGTIPRSSFLRGALLRRHSINISLKFSLFKIVFQ